MPSFSLPAAPGCTLPPDAFISIDINPSLELGINRFDKVVSVAGWNEDGNDLADSLDIKYMDYSDAIETLLSDQIIENYLSQDGLMDLTAACENTSRHDEIMENVESCTSRHFNVHCHSGDAQEMLDTHEEGLSFGKYWDDSSDISPASDSCTPGGHGNRSGKGNSHGHHHE